MRLPWCAPAKPYPWSLPAHGIAGKLIAKIVQGEFETRRQFHGVCRGFRQISKQLLHLLRRLQVALAVMRQQTSGSVERAMIADTGKHIEDLPLFTSAILRTLCRQQRQIQAARKFHCSLITDFLRAIVVTLQLNINIVVTVNRNKLIEQFSAGLDAPLRKRMRQRPFVSAS